VFTLCTITAVYWDFTRQHGQAATDFVLDGVSLTSHRGRPLVIAFGSWSCPEFVASLPALLELYNVFSAQVSFLLVYIRERSPELHPLKDKGLQHRNHSFKEFKKKYRIPFPVVADTPEDTVANAYLATPNRLVILDQNGTIVHFHTFMGIQYAKRMDTSLAEAPKILRLLLQIKEKE